MEKIAIIKTPQKIGQKVRIVGRVQAIRDHGKILFADIADDTGPVQTVTREKLDLSPYDVLEVEGEVRLRPKDLVNPDLATGTIEVAISGVKIISKSKTPPLPTEGDGYDIEENLRLKYRYLDLRRGRLQKNLRARHQIVTLARDFLNKEGFVEIETPYLSKTTPEGARDFLVPSRLNRGKFYALAQAPQQYKQLLMIAGFERYYQFARAFRDEDLRADRQFEHTQIDIEMANVSREDILGVIEKMFLYIARDLDRKVFKIPFPVFTYKEAIAKFGQDKFDLRGRGVADSLAFAWVVDFPLLEYIPGEKRYTFSHNPFSAPKEEHIGDLLAAKNLGKIESYQYDLVLNGEELGSGSIRIIDPVLQRQVFKVMGYEDRKIEEDFGHLLAAYQYGAPKHGGIAVGLDRLVAVLCGEKNIREVMAFPTSGSGQTAVMDAPSKVDEELLDELGLKLS